MKGRSENVESELQILVEECKKLEAELKNVRSIRDKYVEKRKILYALNETYKKFDETKIKIDLTDVNGDKVDINSKDNSIASTYLKDRECYEFNIYTESKEINCLDEKGEMVLEPLKFDGFAFRTLEEDVKFDEMEKNTKKDKKGKKK